MAYRMTLIPMTLSEREGNLNSLKPF